MWKNNFSQRSEACKMFQTLLRVGLKSKKHVKKLFFQSPTRYFGLFKFDQASGEFLKNMVEISEIVGFFGRFDIF